MTDEEKRVDKEIQSHLKKVYGFSEDQLLKEVEAAEKSVNDLDFSGAEDRIYKKMMERKAEREKKEEKVKKFEPADPIAATVPDKPAASIKPPVSDRPAKSVESTTSEKSTEENSDNENTSTKKVVRFKKKKFLLVAAAAAILAMMLGSTAIGEKNFFLRPVGDDITYSIAVDNDKNKLDPSKLEMAYQKIEKELNVEVLKLGYIPQKLLFESLVITDGKALIIFDYDGNKVHLVQEQKNVATSISTESDRKEAWSDPVTNEWLGQEIVVYQQKLSNDQVEYSVDIYNEEAQYRLMGIMEKDEFKKVIENLFCF